MVSGPDKADDLKTGWQWGIALGLVGGMLLVLSGLLVILAVAAGTPKTLTLADFEKLGAIE